MKKRLFQFAPGLILALLIGIWWVLTVPSWKARGTPLIDPIILPPPQAVGAGMVQLIIHGKILVDVGATLVRLLAALGLAILAGIPLGLLFACFRPVYRAIEGVVHALRSVPAAALFPLFLIVVGVGEGSIILLAWYNSATVILISTVSGALLANESRVRQGRILGMNGWQIATQVLFWEALPHIFSGIRVALGYSLALVIAVEMFIGIGQEGLGRKIFDFQAAYRIPETYASIILAGTIGVGLNSLLSLVEKWALQWVPRGQAQ